MQIGGPRGLLITSGRALFYPIFGVMLSLLLRTRAPLVAAAALCGGLGFASTLYLMLTILTWPQRAPRPLAAVPTTSEADGAPALEASA